MPDDFRVPDYPAPIRGFRIWRVTFFVSDRDFEIASYVMFNGGHPEMIPSRVIPVLGSWNMNMPWGPGRNVASCLRADHPAPTNVCTCGLYATNRLWDIWTGEPTATEDYDVRENMHRIQVGIPGVFEAWGRIIEHDGGFRAEWGRPVALLNVSRWSKYLTTTGGVFDLIAQLYGTHLVDHPEILEEFVTMPGMYAPSPTPNPNARLMVGGPMAGTVCDVASGRDEVRFPVAGPDMSVATYRRISGATYKFDGEAA